MAGQHCEQIPSHSRHDWPVHHTVTLSFSIACWQIPSHSRHDWPVHHTVTLSFSIACWEIKGTPLRSVLETDLKRHFMKTCFFLLSTLFLFNRYIPILNQVAKSIEKILRYYKISYDTLNTTVTRKKGFPKFSF